MRTVCTLLLLLTLFSLYGNVWESDYNKAHALCQKESKELLLFFTGSDWSGPSMKMKKEVLEKESFTEALKDHLVLVEVDFPKHHKIEKERALQNQALRERYQVENFPCLLLIGQGERIIARLDYLPEKREKLSSELLHILSLDKRVRAALAQITEGKQLSGKELKELYRDAEELGQKCFLSTLIEAGMKSEESSFFMLQLYHSLASEGLLETKRAKSLKRTLLGLGQEPICYSLALIEFQELSRKAKEPECVIAPLKEYLAEFEKSGSERVWRVEMMAAQVYMSFDCYEKAHEYARRAYSRAPEALKSEIAESLTYIEEQSKTLAGS